MFFCNALYSTKYAKTDANLEQLRKRLLIVMRQQAPSLEPYS